MNVLDFHDDTLFFYGFSKLGNTVSILFSTEESPVVIASGEGRSSITCFELQGHKCKTPQIIDYFVKKGAIGHSFVEVGNRYIQSPICPKLTPADTSQWSQQVNKEE